MRTVKGDIEEIKEILQQVEHKFVTLDSPDATLVLSWVVRHLQYIGNIYDETANSTRKSRSYATCSRRMAQHARSTVKAVDAWQKFGLLPPSVRLGIDKD